MQPRRIGAPIVKGPSAAIVRGPSGASSASAVAMRRSMPQSPVDQGLQLLMTQEEEEDEAGPNVLIKVSSFHELMQASDLGIAACRKVSQACEFFRRQFENEEMTFADVKKTISKIAVENNLPFQV